MTGAPSLMPDIVVDCAYMGDLNPDLKGEKVTITDCINVLNEKYTQVMPDFELDNIATRVLIRKGEFVEQSVLKRIILEITNF